MFVKPIRQVKKVFLHCSANSNPNWKINDLKKSHLARGFNDIGYHFFIDFNGTIYKGRDLEIIPSAQKGYNTNSIAICLHGGLNSKNDFKEIQLNKCKELCLQINSTYNNNITFHGHCEVESGKDCPVFDYKKLLNLNQQGYVVL